MIQQMESLSRPFRPTPYALSPHMQNIIAALLRRSPSFTYQRFACRIVIRCFVMILTVTPLRLVPAVIILIVDTILHTVRMSIQGLSCCCYYSATTPPPVITVVIIVISLLRLRRCCSCDGYYAVFAVSF